MDRLTSIQTIEHTDGSSHKQVYCFGHLWGPAFFKKGTNDYEEYLAIVKRLAEYEDLEEQGKLLKLPCAVGDEFYCIWRNKGQNPIQKMQVKKIEIHERKGMVFQMEFVGNRGCLFRFYEDDFGKTVFLTESAAENALITSRSEEARKDG